MKIKMIAIDGPAASGKTTLAEKLARQLGYLFFDTGVMYRAVTLEALTQLGSTNNEEEVTRIAQTVEIDIRTREGGNPPSTEILLNGVDVTEKIRSTDVDAHVSQVSAYSGVRKAMTEQQRRIGLRGSVVMVGRDIGTVVLPEADLKIYLDASPEERARRRYEEVKKKGGKEDYQLILQAIRKRDLIDSTRSIAPLLAASDAIIIDTDRLSEDEVFQKVLRVIDSK